MCQVVDGEPTFDAPAYLWALCPDEVTPATHVFDGEKFVVKPAPVAEVNAVESAKRARLAELEELDRRVQRGVPQDEINSMVVNLLRGA